MSEPLQVLVVGADVPDLGLSPWGPFACHPCADLAAASEALQRAPMDALLFVGADDRALQGLLHWPALSQCVIDAALVAQVPAPPPRLALELLQRGAQDVLCSRETSAEALARACGWRSSASASSRRRARPTRPTSPPGCPTMPSCSST
jgi:hypothetical protein